MKYGGKSCVSEDIKVLTWVTGQMELPFNKVKKKKKSCQKHRMRLATRKEAGCRELGPSVEVSVGLLRLEMAASQLRNEEEDSVSCRWPNSHSERCWEPLLSVEHGPSTDIRPLTSWRNVHVTRASNRGGAVIVCSHCSVWCPQDMQAFNREQYLPLIGGLGQWALPLPSFFHSCLNIFHVSSTLTAPETCCAHICKAFKQECTFWIRMTLYLEFKAKQMPFVIYYCHTGLGKQWRRAFSKQ